MSSSRNPLFVGREDDLLALRRGLAEALSPAAVAITGMSGVGKTRLALEFIHRHSALYRGDVFWLNFAAPASIAAKVADCGQGMGLHPAFERLLFDERVALVLAAWQQPIPRLLVFDDYEDEQLLERWHPRVGRCSVLLTSH